MPRKDILRQGWRKGRTRTESLLGSGDVRLEVPLLELLAVLVLEDKLEGRSVSFPLRRPINSQSAQNVFKSISIHAF
jgi:hypothetical protein